MARTIITELASIIDARARSKSSGNTEWFQRHTDRIANIASELLPRGSGIDSGTTVDLDRSNAQKVVLLVPFHVMNDAGMYDGWRDFVVIVRPAFGGHTVTVTGRDYNGLKEYLGDLYYQALLEPMPEGFWTDKGDS